MGAGFGLTIMLYLVTAWSLARFGIDLERRRQSPRGGGFQPRTRSGADTRSRKCGASNHGTLASVARTKRDNLGSNVSGPVKDPHEIDAGYSLFCKEKAIKPRKAPSPPFHVTNHAEAAHWACAVVVPSSWVESSTTPKERQMSHAYQLNAAVLHRGQGPQGRVQIEEPKVYTVIQRMPVESDGRIRYRIKSDKIERIVTEDELSYCQ
jgi:hypothetical protein